MLFLVLVSAAATYVVISRQCCRKPQRRPISCELANEFKDL